MNLRQSATFALLSLVLPALAHSTSTPKAFEDRTVSAQPAAPERGERRARPVHVRTIELNRIAIVVFVSEISIRELRW